MPRLEHSTARVLPALLLAGIAALTLSACASNRAGPGSPDFSSQTPAEAQTTLGDLATRFRTHPQDKATVIRYAAARRAPGQAAPAIAPREGALGAHRAAVANPIADSQARSAGGRFQQALNVIDGAIDPAVPDWNALSVKGAILDQTGANQEARLLYRQALLIAPEEASLYANLGLSYSMTNELPEAEAHLRRAAGMAGATSKIRQNLALVVGLQGRFEECRLLFAAELPADQVEANLAYIRALLTQQNRWELVKGAT